jgi:hypothetical protein
LDVTWSDLRKSAQSVEEKIVLDLAILKLSDNPYEEFVGLINRALDCALSYLAKNKNHVHDLGEDQLTVMLMASLKSMTFSARHGENVGGHCDLTIDGPNGTLWIGEAKKFTSYAKLFGGARQLIDRYTTGLEGQDCGAIIVYISKPNALGIMTKWRAFLKRCVRSLLIAEPAADQLDFYTQIEHAGSGRMLNIRHVPAVLYHAPTDILPPPKAGQFGKLGASKD